MQPDPDRFTIETADPQDRDLIQGLLSGASWQHRHLDWTRPLELLGHKPFILASDRGLPVGLLAVPPDPPGISWLRILAVASGYELSHVWRMMWRDVEGQLMDLGIEEAAALSIPPWLPDLLKQVGFTQEDSVEFLEWSEDELPPQPDSPLPLEPLLSTNLMAVAQVDHRAFAPRWRHSLEALQSALKHASYATVLRLSGKVIAYQISTLSQHGGHLARLAVDPDFQGQGHASHLVWDLLHHFKRHGHDRVTVNTQGSNERSHKLYENLGFRSLEQAFPVYVKALNKKHP
ncbi:MAG: GNAT family N-acetyltransferase [Anaerolineales bacterium]